MSGRRGFSLIELLFAVFILSVGVISVSALFPAGIAQQQRSADEQVGPQIADHALGLIRTRVSAADFGCFEDFGIGGRPSDVQERLLTRSVQANATYVYRPQPGDWSWMRPGVIRPNQVGSVGVNLRGALDIFSALAQQQGGSGQEYCEFPNGLVTTVGGKKIYGIPYQVTRKPDAPPVLITQRERWWPTVPEPDAAGSPGTDEALIAGRPPEFAWECMFRRHGGTIQVGIFVFRVVSAGAARQPFYAAPANPEQPALAPRVTGGAYGDHPGLPYRRVLVPRGTGGLLTSADATTGNTLGLQVPVGWQQPASIDVAALGPSPYTTGVIFSGTAAAPGRAGQGLAVDDIPVNGVAAVHHQWQYTGQWIIDNNGNVHRVRRGRRSRQDEAQVWLQAPIPGVALSAPFDDYELQPVSGQDPVPLGVRTLHYIPEVIDERGVRLIPIYATVRNL
jgi:prepilin-type N-terminal cleavage/methylation domain-containing protein